MHMSNGAPSIHTTAGKLNELRRRMAKAQAPVGAEAIDKIHAAGRMTARERVLALLDAVSYTHLRAHET